MSILDGYHLWAIIERGPPDRIYPWRNTMRRIYHHSMEGVHGSYNAVTDPARFPTGWTGTVLRDGGLVQYYRVWDGLAHGGPVANPFGPGYEAEGFAGEPLTAAQVTTFLRIHRDMEELTGYTYTRDGTNRDFRLVEHGEAAPTACPSGRYAPLWAAILEPEEPDMTPDERAEHTAIVAIFGGREKLLAAEAGGMDYLLGYALEQAEQDKLEAAMKVLSGPVGSVGAHKHRTTQQTITTGEVIV